MTPHDTMVLGVQLALGFSLASACGLRAFVPVFVAGLLARLGYVQVGAGYAWMASTPALIVFGSALAFELAGDKIPALDHLLDAAGVVVKPAAATLVTASIFTKLDPLPAAILGLVVGGTAAGGVHVAKAKLRLASSLFTAGIANPALSIVEDLATLAAVALAFLVPLLTAVLALAFFVAAIVLLQRGVRAFSTARSSSNSSAVK